MNQSSCSDGKRRLTYKLGLGAAEDGREVFGKLVQYNFGAVGGVFALELNANGGPIG